MNKPVSVSISRTIIPHLIKFSVLFLLPALVCVYWYFAERQVFYPFSNFESSGVGGLVSDNFALIHEVTEGVYQATKDEFPSRFDQQREPDSEVGSFKLKLSESITQKLGIFSSLPYHRVCLENRNTIFINGVLDTTPPLTTGATGITQKGGYNFYAARGAKDCKNVLLEKFSQSTSTIELGYAITLTINAEENAKRLRGEEYTAGFASTAVRASASVITVTLQWWVLIIAYFFLLFAWSFVYFQYEKIFEYLKSDILSLGHRK